MKKYKRNQRNATNDEYKEELLINKRKIFVCVCGTQCRIDGESEHLKT